MTAAMDDRPCLFAAVNGAGSLFTFFNNPCRIVETLRFPLTGTQGSIVVVVGPDRRPAALQVLNAWKVGTESRQFDFRDPEFKWQLYEAAVVIVQLAGSGAEGVQDTLLEVVQLAQRTVQARISGRSKSAWTSNSSSGIPQPLSKMTSRAAGGGSS